MRSKVKLPTWLSCGVIAGPMGASAAGAVEPGYGDWWAPGTAADAAARKVVIRVTPGPASAKVAQAGG